VEGEKRGKIQREKMEIHTAAIGEFAYHEIEDM
jgi:hypothetical protein